MATVHVNGTQLEPQQESVPLNKVFLASIGVIFLVAMHFFMPNPGGSGLALSFNPTTWLALSITIAIGCYQLATNRVLRYSKLTIGLLISALIMSLPICFPNADISATAPRLFGLWAGLALFVLLQQFRFSNRHKQRLLWFIVLATLIQALFGLYQYTLLEPGNMFGYNTVANFPSGIFQQKNVMASFLATGLIVSGYLLARQPDTKYHHKISDIIILYVIPAVTIPLLIVLASRTGWLTAVLGIICILPYIHKYTSLRRFLGWTGSLVAGLILGWGLLASQGKSEAVIKKADFDTPRTYTFPQALDMAIEKPFTGYGYGKFESQYILYTARQHQLNINYPAGLPAMDHPHNELLFWAVEGGLIPIVGILLAAYLVLSRIQTNNQGTRLATFALFIPIVVHSQLEYPFYHSAVHWITFIILIYWVDQRSSQYRTVPFSIVSKTLLRVSSLLLPALTAFYMLSALHTNYVLTQFEKSQPRDPEILNQVSNPVVWKDRFDWNIYSTYLSMGLYSGDKTLIQPYVDWSNTIIQSKPRPAFYRNLILAYQGLGDDSRARQVRSEAELLFPKQDFSQLHYQPPSSAPASQSSSQSSSQGSELANNSDD
ncbi:ligase [Vibrio sp. 10N.286.49.B3]|uniref:PglL family O-oligosaccharyltransferase n=1 Tax=Vibrio sp. 10N.286.49.B3 TaxID=1880855 RepID=UPI000C851EC4|nr:PglL family O-oligosaccharyltransferase [Vibrio sp. 10N.286.49.B3]PMH39914.1 ligase [Vibrio sp. 10N.286.49.B3]